MTSEQNYFVTHIIVPKIFEDDLNQLFFYTIKDRNLQEIKYYWGKGNNSFNQKFIDDLLRQNKIKKLDTKIYPLPLKSNETLWIDREGVIYTADLNNPLLNQKKISKLER